MYRIPTNFLPFLIGFPIFAFFSWRAFSNYRRLHNPLSGYFALTGILAAAAFFFSTVPLLFTRQTEVVIAVESIGDICLYLMMALQADIVHYLRFRNSLPRALFVVPSLVLALIGIASNVYGYLHYGISVSDQAISYTLPLLSSVAQSLLLVNVLLVGVLLLVQMKEQSSVRSRNSLLGIAALYIFSGIAGLINVLSSGTANHSPVIIVSYIGGFIIFLAVMLISRLHVSASR